MPKHLLPTTVVGSYPQPEWLVDRAMLLKVVPRTRMHAMWRLPEEHLEEAQDDATLPPPHKAAQDFVVPDSDGDLPEVKIIASLKRHSSRPTTS